MGSARERAPFSCFLDRAQAPSLARVRIALGKARAAWDELVAHLADVYGLEGALHFMYGERYGWALRFRRGGRLVLAMYPNRGCMTVQIVLGQGQVAAATTMKLPPRVRKVFLAAKEYPEGRWLFIPVRSQSGAEELKRLIALKMSRPSRPRGAGRVEK